MSINELLEEISPKVADEMTEEEKKYPKHTEIVENEKSMSEEKKKIDIVEEVIVQ